MIRVAFEKFLVSVDGADVVLLFLEDQADAKLRVRPDFAERPVLDDLLVNLDGLVEPAEDAEAPDLVLLARQKQIADLKLTLERGLEVRAVWMFLDQSLVFLERLVIIAERAQAFGRPHARLLRR